MPTGRRSETTTSIVDGRDRRMATSRTHGDFRSCSRQRSRSVQTRLCPTIPSSPLMTSAFDRRSFPRMETLSMRSACAWAAMPETRYSPYASATPVRTWRTIGTTTAFQWRCRRPGLTCARRNRRSAGTATGLTASLRRRLISPASPKGSPRPTASRPSPRSPRSPARAARRSNPRPA